jgi:DNA-directed RNA polymerase specialized sigma24 family protein
MQELHLAEIKSHVFSATYILARHVHYSRQMNRSAYGQAYQAGFERTIRFLISRGAGRDRAQEAAQAAWVRGWERLNQLRNEEMLLTWVNTIALNIYRRVLKKEERFQQPLPEVYSRLRIDMAAIDVARILKFCRPRERQLLELQMQGATTEEIARHNGVTETAIRIRLMRARRAARAFTDRRLPIRTDRAA